ncbi:hypothetical protein A3740_03240 [Oleiphilus sp. HI0068]|uniref:3'-5' exonuclease n=3 Tax=Oleiphilus TaxID=141450 RepID=UPI0007C3A846|nr:MULTISPECIES: 3'-5' exonuclease [unclassified Oleiphilus]KZY73756.1 hypothetical protein A3740_03240 [Oleiphilus sp. HI0068]KZY84152.1 hypothetical protein A3741_16275 [Oleiphilus sp. HI0069]KZZ46301.1 hypothetical protein A3755_18940 [Oleiphilus sp. HI0085]KZY37728.1 hypothetical protein A3729_16395 [Oleiphilus sp. HI0043]KZZ67909.1 hypothetical protein A3763_15240 [Oleiphilus sp. HI0128]
MEEIELLAIDIETTGLDPRDHRICEFGAVKFNSLGEIIDTFSILVNPGRSIPFPAYKVHGIKAEMVENAPTPREGWDQLLEWAGSINPFVSHNASFECGFIQALYKSNEDKPNFKIYDTLKLSRRQLKDESSYKLEKLIPSLAGKGHRALPDAEACAELFLKIAKTYKSNRIPKTNEKDFWAIDYFEENKPSNKQLSYIESLGGDQGLPKTKMEASEYIDELKGLKESAEREANRPLKESSGSGMVMFAAIILTIVVVAYFVG